MMQNNRFNLTDIYMCRAIALKVTRYYGTINTGCFQLILQLQDIFLGQKER